MDEPYTGVSSWLQHHDDHMVSESVSSQPFRNKILLDDDWLRELSLNIDWSGKEFVDRAGGLNNVAYIRCQSFE